MSQDEPDVEQPAEVHQLMRDVRTAMNDLPIIARLQFAANLVFDAGGIRGSDTTVPELVIAYDVLSDVINVLERHPDAVGLKRTPFPEKTPAP